MNPHDPDPLTVDEEAHGRVGTYRAVEWWDEGHRRGREARRLDLLMVLLAGVVIGCAATILASRVSATSRSEPAPSIPVTAQARSEASRAGVVERSRAGDGPPTAWDRSIAGPEPVGSNATVDASLSGTASWYPARGFIAAAGPGLRTGHWRGRSLVVSANGRSVTVVLADWCACPRRLVDLSDDAFARLAPLSRGLVHVTVSSAGPAPTPPMTDSAP